MPLPQRNQVSFKAPPKSMTEAKIKDDFGDRFPLWSFQTTGTIKFRGWSAADISGV
jgi:predicted oxidoreductase (fatty acid repression mutant protein)